MRLSDLSKVFEVMCDTSGVLSQEKHPIAFFGEKLSGIRLITQPTTKNFMWLCNLCTSGDIIFCRKDLSFTRMMKPFDNLRRSSVLGMAMDWIFARLH